MKTRWITNVGFLICAVLLVITTGCVTDRRTIWVSDVDLETCKLMARKEFEKGFSTKQIDQEKTVLMKIEDWRLPSITVFIPMRETPPLVGATYAYYPFQGTNRYCGKPRLDVFSSFRTNQLELMDFGLSSWSTGPVYQRR